MLNKYMIFISAILLSSELAYGAAMSSKKQEELVIIASFSEIFKISSPLVEVECKLGEAIKDITALKNITTLERDTAITKLYSQFAQYKKDIAKKAEESRKNAVQCQFAESIVDYFSTLPSGLKLIKKAEVCNQIRALNLIPSDHVKYIRKIETILETDFKRKSEAERYAELQFENFIYSFDPARVRAEQRQKYFNETRTKIMDLASIDLVRRKKALEDLKRKLEAVNSKERDLLVKKNKEFFDAIDAEDYYKVNDLIKSGADVNAVTLCPDCDNLHTALMWAGQGDSEAIVKLLIDRGADVNIPDSDGLTILMLAAEQNWTIVAQLLIHNNVNLDVAHDDGQTALMMAAAEGNIDIVKLLIENGADIDRLSNEGKKAVDFAKDNSKIRELLEIEPVRRQSILDRRKQVLLEKMPTFPAVLVSLISGYLPDYK